MSGAIVTQRTRGSERRERILAAAAELIAERGYHAVSMTDLGVAAGIVGPGIYRHFDSKAAVLASLFERVIDALLERASTIVDQARDEREALTGLVADHVSLVINDRLRRKQRLYLEEWVHVVAELRPELDEADVRAVVHGAIGAIQSILHYRDTGLPPERVAARLAAMGYAVLGIAASDDLPRIVNDD